MFRTLRRIAERLGLYRNGKALAGERAICLAAFDVAHPHH